MVGELEGATISHWAVPILPFLSLSWTPSVHEISCHGGQGQQAGAWM